MSWFDLVTPATALPIKGANHLPNRSSRLGEFRRLSAVESCGNQDSRTTLVEVNFRVATGSTSLAEDPDPSYDFRLGEGATHDVVGEICIHGIGHYTGSIGQFIGPVQLEERIQREQQDGWIARSFCNTHCGLCIRERVASLPERVPRAFS